MDPAETKSREAHLQYRDRKTLEQLEQTVLAPYAALSRDWAATRTHAEPEHPYRTAFQRDRDRIIHSRAFRRLKHKRQVFLTHSGDHYRTRLTHTFEVAQLSRTVARTLGLNEDLVEAIALGHDLGHTPFGHIGEVVLHRIMSGQDTLDNLLPRRDLGGYKHNYQSLRVVEKNEKKYGWDGLNLTAAVREGILKHTRLKKGSIQYPELDLRDLHYELDNATTLEGQAVAVCDEVAQRTHDLEDGIRALYVDVVQVRELAIVRRVEREAGIEAPDASTAFLYRNKLIRSLIDVLITDLLDESLARLRRAFRGDRFFPSLVIGFSAELDPLQAELDRFITARIISVASEKRSDERAVDTIRELFRRYFENPGLLPDYRLSQCMDEDTLEAMRNESRRRAIHRDLRTRPDFLRAICDHIAGMTDNYAEQQIERLRALRGEPALDPHPFDNP